MVKSKKKGTKPTARKTAVPRAMPRITMDGGAVDHINLMRNPCQGRLVPPAYATTGGGAIMRFRRVITLGGATGENAGIFHWLPGLNQFFANGAAGSTSTFTPSSASMFTFLTTSGTNNDTSATSFRAVAACARILTNASEMNRSGIVYAGMTDGQYYGTKGAAVANVEISVGGLPFTTRMPSKSLEILWIGGALDTEFYVDLDNTTIVVGEAYSRNAITFGFTGGATATGVTIEVTGVYEVNFPSRNNLVASKGPPSTNTPWSTIANGFFKAIANSPVIVDGLNRVVDFAASGGASTVGGYAARAAVGLLM